MKEPDKAEMQELVENLKELRNRFAVAILAVGLASIIVVFVFGSRIIPFMIHYFLPKGTKVIALSPIEYIYSIFLISVVIGIYVATPVIIYEIFKFAEPGLYPNEKNLFVRIVPSSFILLTMGLLFSFFVVIPPSTKFLVFYTQETAEPMLVLSRFVSAIGVMILSIGMIFQLPLVIAFLVKAKLVTVSWLKHRRRYMYAILLAIGFFFSPDPTPITPMIIALTLVFIFELSLIFAEHLL
ncbi:MAG TPA: twin-arginine translocase subunit TatC [Euryarchaeota archaeon]|nr:sec-independent protein translocase protein TatC [archaeon BMS3Bbin15]HDL15154.1 twin-arginine translocase subunit TatC [Euryarchaeota archaeon]